MHQLIQFRSVGHLGLALAKVLGHDPHGIEHRRRLIIGPRGNLARE